MSPELKLSLRERKYAQTKVALMKTAVDWLETKALDDIAVKDLCEAVPVSEATFYNYFPKKTDLLVYFIQLWTIENVWQMRHIAEIHGLRVIDRFFEYLAAYTQQHPHLMGEVMMFYLHKKTHPTPHTITPAELQLAFPNCAGIESLEEWDMDKVLIEYLTRAMQTGELPPQTDIAEILLHLYTIMLGVPIAAKLSDQPDIGRIYRQQLHVLWAGLRATSS